MPGVRLQTRTMPLTIVGDEGLDVEGWGEGGPSLDKDDDRGGDDDDRGGEPACWIGELEVSEVASLRNPSRAEAPGGDADAEPGDLVGHLQQEDRAVGDVFSTAVASDGVTKKQTGVRQPSSAPNSKSGQPNL